MKTIVPILFLALISMPAQSAVQTKAIDYKDDGTALTGHRYWDDAFDRRRPGEMNSYGGARHGFTNPDATQFGIDNLVYDKRADDRSWARMQGFFRRGFRLTADR